MKHGDSSFVNQNFLVLSLGLVFAFTRHTVASYLWRAGAASFKHFTWFYVFLGAPCYDRLDRLFERVIVAAARHVPEDEEDRPQDRRDLGLPQRCRDRPPGVAHTLGLEFRTRREAHPALGVA